MKLTLMLPAGHPKARHFSKSSLRTFEQARQGYLQRLHVRYVMPEEDAQSYNSAISNTSWRTPQTLSIAAILLFDLIAKGLAQGLDPHPDADVKAGATVGIALAGIVGGSCVLLATISATYVACTRIGRCYVERREARLRQTQALIPLAVEGILSPAPTQLYDDPPTYAQATSPSNRDVFEPAPPPPYRPPTPTIVPLEPTRGYTTNEDGLETESSFMV